MNQSFFRQSIPQKDWQALLDQLAHGALVIDGEGTIFFSNCAHHQMLGYEPGELLGKKVWELLPSQSGKDRTRMALAELVCKQPPPKPLQMTFLRKEGTRALLHLDWNYLNEADGSVKGFIVLVSDLTERNRRQKQLLRTNQGLTTLLKLSQNVVGTLDVQKTLQEMVNGISRLVGLGTSAIYLVQGDMLRLSATFPPLPPDFPESLQLARKSDHPHLARAIDNREPLLVPDLLKEPLTSEEKAVVVQRGLRTALYVPVISDNDVQGVLIVNMGDISMKTFFLIKTYF